MLRSRQLTQRKTLAIQQLKQVEEAKEPKDFAELVNDKLLSEANSDWFGCELLFHVKINKRSKTARGGVSGLGGNSKDMAIMGSATTEGKSDRHLALIRKKDEGNGPSIFVVVVIARGQTIETKGVWDIRRIKGADAGNDDDLILSHEPVDSTFFFNNKSERDETLWIVVQVCKASNHHEVSVGYLVDMDAMGYAINTNGTVNRFPLLHKLLSSTGYLNGEEFGEEEAEAESVLEDLKWTSTATGNGMGGLDLKDTLHKQSDALNVEIIDFLLQWEELDDAAAGAPAVAAPTAIVPNARMRDTVEILEALNQVDKELEDVNTWLSDQIDRLCEIQSNLSLIENESGGLETSWQNLQSIYEIISKVIDVLSIDGEEEDMLKSPDKVMMGIIKVNPKKPHKATLENVDDAVLPLVEAANKLKAALNFRGGLQPINRGSVSGGAKATASTGGLITPQVWKQLLSMSAIIEQRQRLLSLGEQFCAKSSEAFVAIFTALPKHPALGDMSVNDYDLDRLLGGEALLAGPRRGRRKSSSSGSSSSDRSNHSPLEYCQSVDYEDNLLLTSQRMIHAVLTDFAPLMDKVLEINNALAKPLSASYSEAMAELVYGVMMRDFQRDIKNVVTPKHIPVTLASIPRYRYGHEYEVPVRFFPSTSKSSDHHQTLRSPWAIFELLLILMMPVITKEEAFYRVMFSIDSLTSEARVEELLKSFYDPSIPFPKMKGSDFTMDIVFSTFVKTVEKLASTSSTYVNTGTTAASASGEIDIAETVGMLTVLQQFTARYLLALPSKSSKDEPRETLEPCEYTIIVLHQLRGYLNDRVRQFQGDQSKWIQSQKGDPKKAGISVPFAKFVALMHQIDEMLCGQQINCIDELLIVLSKELFSWISVFASQNDKYADVIKLQNFYFFEHSLKDLSTPSISKFAKFAAQQREEAEARYILWMVTYEFPSLSDLATRMEGVGSRVREEELALYIRRKDVLHVIKELDLKLLESSISTMRKRLVKHVYSAEDSELKLVSKLWKKLKSKTVDIIRKLEVTAMASYQLTLEVTPQLVSDAFDKQRDG